MKRWSDDAANFVANIGFEDVEWDTLASDRDFWSNLEEQFAYEVT